MGLQPIFKRLQLFLMRTESLASSQSCRSIDTARCERRSLQDSTLVPVHTRCADTKHLPFC